MSELSIEIKKYTLAEIAALFESDFAQNSEVLPISKLRLSSYLNNPRAQKNDTVLYLALHNNRIVGFRTILADAVFNGDVAYRFGWLSGAWVDPSYRRMGLSTKLFNLVFEDWGENLMFTNYAPNAKLLLDRTNKFDLFKSEKGIRLYFKSTLHKIIPERKAKLKFAKPFLKLIDNVINGFFSPYNKPWIKVGELSNKVQVVAHLNETDYKFMGLNTQSVFKRGSDELKWIVKYPWVIESDKSMNKYPFSQYSKEFEYVFIKQLNKDDSIEALAILKLRDAKLTVPYFFSNTSSLAMCNAVLKIGLQRKVETITLYNEQLLQGLAKIKTRVLFSKAMVQKYFITKAFNKKLNLPMNAICVQDGDGDCFFT